jgi:hypothetical protein
VNEKRGHEPTLNYCLNRGVFSALVVMVCYPVQPIVRTVNLDINALMPVDQAELQARQRQARPQGTSE